MKGKEIKQVALIALGIVVSLFLVFKTTELISMAWKKGQTSKTII